jgi:hypothetical protein
VDTGQEPSDTSHLGKSRSHLQHCDWGQAIRQLQTYAHAQSIVTNTRSYEQNNSMTQVSWGEAKKVIAKDKLIGKTAKLFKTKKKGEFTLEIS